VSSVRVGLALSGARENLDEARKLDPDGENLPAVKDARKRIADAERDASRP
jgi:hypothetical protein